MQISTFLFLHFHPRLIAFLSDWEYTSSTNQFVSQFGGLDLVWGENLEVLTFAISFCLTTLSNSSIFVYFNRKK